MHQEQDSLDDASQMLGQALKQTPSFHYLPLDKQQKARFFH